MMRSLAAAVLAMLLSSAACRTHDPLFCDQTHPCTDPARPYGAPQGIYPGSDGHGKSCVPNPFDAEVAADAPAAPDGAADGAVDAEGAIDAPAPDSAPDAPPGPLVVTGQLP